MRYRSAHARRGVAILMAIVAMALLVIVMGAVTAQIVTARRQLIHREQQLQSQALARAGLELAAARLLSNAAPYQEDTPDIMPRAHVRIDVQRISGAADTFRVTCGVMYPVDEPHPVMRILTRQYRRVVEGNRVRLEVVAEKDG
jgi:hypothetical protein